MTIYKTLIKGPLKPRFLDLIRFEAGFTSKGNVTITLKLGDQKDCFRSPVIIKKNYIGFNNGKQFYLFPKQYLLFWLFNVTYFRWKSAPGLLASIDKSVN